MRIGPLSIARDGRTTLNPVHRTPTTSGRPRRTASSLLLALALVVLAACGGERPTLGAAPDPSSPRPSTTTAVELVAEPGEPGPETMLGFIATPLGVPEVFSEPDRASEPIEVPAETAVGERTTLAVVGDADAPAQPHPGWFKVLLPTRPNGATGWVPAETVEVTHTPFRVTIELDDRRILVEQDGVEVFTTFIAIGTEENPTPLGSTYVTELIQTLEPDGAYGPYAFGLALHSDTLTEFAGGPGQVGVHGTNQPDLIGQPVSHGCVRLTNDDIEALVDLGLPLGVPVFIA